MPARRLAIPKSDEQKSDSVTASVERTTELDREWTERRLEAYRAIDATVHESIGNVLKTAVDVRQAMEQEARLILDALRTDRDRIIGEIRDLRRERDEITSDMLSVRRLAEEEALRVRAAAESQAAAILAEAESRRTALLAEVSNLDQHVNEVSGQFQSLFDEAALRSRAARSATLRSSPITPRTTSPVEPETRRFAPARPAAPPARTDRPPTIAVDRAPLSAAPTGPVATTERIPVIPEPAESTTRVVETRRREPELTTPHIVPPAPRRARPPIDAVLPAISPDSSAPDDRSLPASNPPPRDASASSSASTPVPTQKTNVAIVGIPSFARAIEIQRAIQRSPVVRHVQGLGLEHGRFTIAVEHDPGVDLSSTIAQELRIEITVTAESEGNLELGIGG